MIKVLSFLFLLLFSSIVALAQQKRLYYESLTTASLMNNPKEENAEISGLKEEVSKRTRYSRSFRNSKGDIRQEYSKKPLCYERNGSLRPIVSSPVASPDGSWQALDQEVGTALNQEGKLKLFFSEKDTLTFQTHEFNGSLVHIKGFESGAAPKFYMQLNESVFKSVSFIDGGFKVNYILHSAPAIASEDLLIREKIELPQNWKMVKENDEVLFLNGEKTMGILGQILCFDQNNVFSKGSYEILEIDNYIILTLRIDGNWINGNRQYPVVIDPIVAGTPSLWAGGNMPSCFMPNYSQDSLLVDIPAGISLTGLYVSSSFYADPFSGATMGMGSMYFSTDCASSQYFTITGALATSPGTAYLDSFNLMNPLSCCYPKSCNDTSIYVSFHIGRNALGTGCNTNYIRYDQFTQYPFKVVIYGKTPESYGNEWYVSQTPICSNNCEFTATGYARFGVPPYTFSHPWCQDTIVSGVNEGCSTGSKNNVFTLVNPNCPIYCDGNYTQLPVPPPVITDACGSQVMNIPIATKPIIPAALPFAEYDSTICEGNDLNIVFTSCLAGGVVDHFGNGTNGQGPIVDTLYLINDSINTFTYYAYATINGCISDTLIYNAFYIPNPQVNMNISPNPCVVETPINISSSSVSYPGSQLTNVWTMDFGVVSNANSFDSTFLIPGVYPVCLAIQDVFGCSDTLCANINIIPAEIENINIITPNDDNNNDVLFFDYLDAYDQNELYIFNRWGNEVYFAKNYQNDWSGDGLTDGVYFYILKILDIDKTYSSFIHLVK
jgi:gliding motility-associated-like protein